MLGHYRITNDALMSQNYVLWPICVIMIVFIALKEIHLRFVFDIVLHYFLRTLNGIFHVCLASRLSQV